MKVESLAALAVGLVIGAATPVYAQTLGAGPNASPAMVRPMARPQAQILRNYRSDLAPYAARRASIQSHLTPQITASLLAVARSQQSTIVASPEATLQAIAATLHREYPRATPAQLNVLTFSAAEIAAERDLDALNAMGEIDQLRLQSLMDQRSKLLEMMSNLMKMAASTAETIMDNMK